MDLTLSEEQARLDVLHACGILDTPAEPFFDRIVQFAASACHTPIATISLIDRDRQWFKAAVGLSLNETARTIAFCSHTIRQRHPMVVRDALADRRFRDSPLVTGPLALRFYAGIPLVTADGHAIGSLAVMDRRPRRLHAAKLGTLRMLADLVTTHIELRRKGCELQRALAASDEAHALLARRTEHLREAQRIASLGSWEMDLPLRELHLSEETLRMFGVPDRPHDVPFAAFLESVHRDDRAMLVAAVEEAIASGRRLDVEHRIVRPPGAVRHVHERGEMRVLDDGRRCLAGTVQDITEQHHAQEQLKLLHACIARVDDVVMICEADAIEEPGPRIVFVNQAFERVTGYAEAETLGRSPRFLQGPNTQRPELDRIRRALEHGQPVSAEVINYTKCGREFWNEMDIAPASVAGERITHFVAVQRDITERKNFEHQIQRLAFFDPLTQLPNRRLLMDRLLHALQLAGRVGTGGALLFIDLDNFKTLNDTLGHDKGDLLLKQVARRLEGTVRRNNTVARLGGDEFVVLLEDLQPDPVLAAAQAEVVAEKVLACFAEPFPIGAYEHTCSPSIGVALFVAAQEDVDELLKRADLAMYQAKAAGRNTIRFFDPQMQSSVNARVALDRELRMALQRGHFVLHYQPQVDQEGRMVGVEALLRWPHPQRGLLHPCDFIGLAEETGLIVGLGGWVLEAACRQLAEWHRLGNGHPPRISVNVSARQFHHPDFLPQALQALEASGVDPHRIKLELTETAFVERLDDTVAKMAELKRRGVQFSLDDFGTGYSSLSYLKRLPLDEVKIDRAFVRDVLSDPNDAAIARTIISLGHTLGLDVVAEGVETEGQRAFLSREGCGVYQGYLVGRPVPAHEVMM